MATNDKELRRLLDEYKEWVSMGWTLSESDSDDLFHTISLREDIHEFFKEHDPNNHSSAIKELRDIDQKWQEQLKKTADPLFTPDWKRSNSKSLWWLWLDKLDDLTQQQRRTI